MSDMLARDYAVHLTPVACLIDSTPPTFAGISGLASNSNGSLTASWLAATDASTPVSYEVYLQAATATGLFSLANIALVTRSLSAKLFQDALAALLTAGTTYFVGVRAVDAVGNRDSNTVNVSAVSSGVLPDSLAAVAASLAATATDLGGTSTDLDATATELDGLVTALAESISPELTGFIVEDELQAVVDADENLTAQLECED